jgi:hypothetical protein
MKLGNRRNVFSYCLKRLVLLIVIGDFQNGETSRLPPVSLGLSGHALVSKVPSCYSLRVFTGQGITHSSIGHLRR